MDLIIIVHSVTLFLKTHTQLASQHAAFSHGTICGQRGLVLDTRSRHSKCAKLASYFLDLSVSLLIKHNSEDNTYRS